MVRKDEGHGGPKGAGGESETCYSLKTEVSLSESSTRVYDDTCAYSAPRGSRPLSVSLFDLFLSVPFPSRVIPLGAIRAYRCAFGYQTEHKLIPSNVLEFVTRSRHLPLSIPRSRPLLDAALSKVNLNL